jgi:hypothetical protein
MFITPLHSLAAGGPTPPLLAGCDPDLENLKLSIFTNGTPF